MKWKFCDPIDVVVFSMIWGTMFLASSFIIQYTPLGLVCGFYIGDPFGWAFGGITLLLTILLYLRDREML